MSRIAYVSGRYLPHRSATVSIDDRGYQFADGVYEVIQVQAGLLVDEALHLERLARSLAALAIAAPMAERALKLVMRQVIRLNRLRDGILYLQITRGVAPREHAYAKGLVPQLVITARPMKPPKPETVEHGVTVITIPDQRWARRDIKSISLLPNILGKQQAKLAGAHEAWQVEPDGTVTEGTASNAWIVSRDGEIVTRRAGPLILNGITRLALIEVAEAEGLLLVERNFTVAEALAAREAFLTSTTQLAIPVTRIDQTVIGDGRPGPVTRALRTALARRTEVQLGGRA